MKQLRGMNNQEIAVELGISENTVKVHLARASQFVRNYITANLAS